MEAGRLEELNVRIAEQLVGRTVAKVSYRREGRELFIEFDGGSRLFVNAFVDLDVSITVDFSD